MISNLKDLAHIKGQMIYPFGPPPDGVDVLWRCESKVFSYTIDPETDRYGTTDPVLHMMWFTVKRWTPTGARLEDGKMVYLDKKITRREWASKTLEEALQSFKERRMRQVNILQHQLNYAQAELDLANNTEL